MAESPNAKIVPCEAKSRRKGGEMRKVLIAALPKHYSNGSPVVREVGYVGFANIPNQVYRRSVKSGFDCTFMVVGKRRKFEECLYEQF